MKIVCGWCNTDLGFKYDLEPVVTTSICQGCLSGLEENLRRRHAAQESQQKSETCEKEDDVDDMNEEPGILSEITL